MIRKTPLNKISAKQAKRRREMARLKPLLMERAQGQCERMILIPGAMKMEVRCQRRAVDPHHLLAVSQGGRDELSNLLAMCRDCHNFCKSHPKDAMIEGIVLKAGKA